MAPIMLTKTRNKAAYKLACQPVLLIVLVILQVAGAGAYPLDLVVVENAQQVMPPVPTNETAGTSDSTAGHPSSLGTGEKVLIALGAATLFATIATPFFQCYRPPRGRTTARADNVDSIPLEPIAERRDGPEPAPDVMHHRTETQAHMVGQTGAIFDTEQGDVGADPTTGADDIGADAIGANVPAQPPAQGQMGGDINVELFRRFILDTERIMALRMFHVPAFDLAPQPPALDNVATPTAWESVVVMARSDGGDDDDTDSIDSLHSFSISESC